MAQRQYWVVSPNVQDSSRTVGDWRQASVKWKAAFMGWGPDEHDHPLGKKFAHKILPDDIILIARRYQNEPEIVGYGRVVGGFKTRLAGFEPPEAFGSLRRLNPFIPMSRAPNHLPFMSALNQTAALHKLHPEWNQSHKRLCLWFDLKLSEAKSTVKMREPRNSAGGVSLASLPKDKQLEYQVRSRRSAMQARRKEAQLLGRYRKWIERQDRKLQVFKTHKIQCDAFEEARHNLIEAKCSEEREYIRMAVGQVLDYAFYAMPDLGKCHKAILLPNRPLAPRLLEWLGSLDISVIWEDGSVFLDNANGRFT